MRVGEAGEAHSTFYFNEDYTSAVVAFMRIRILLRFGDGSPLKATRAKHCSPKTFSYCKAELAREKGLSDRARIAPATLKQDAMWMR